MRHALRVGRFSRSFARIIAVLMLISLSATVTSCGSAGGRSASDWKGTWYREGDSPFSRCYVEISNVSSEGFDFSLTVYNGNKAGELTEDKKTATGTPPVEEDATDGGAGEAPEDKGSSGTD